MPVGRIGKLQGAGSLNERIFDVMDHIEYRRIITPEDFEAIGSLRSEAFDSRIVYSRKLGDSAVDEMDRVPNCHVFGMYYYGELVATVRMHVVSREYPESFSLMMFPETLKPLVDQGMTFIDPTRFAVDEAVSHEVPGLPLLMLRVAFMATTYYQANACLALVKEAHAPFYRRVFRATQLAGPKKFDTFAVPLVLFASPLENEEDICRRYPLFYSTAAERRMMFGNPANAAQPLTILPTAKIAAEAA
jgi:hypothetical protein